MGLSNILSMFGGLALFLYGMHMMSNGLELAAGNKMKTILEKLTTNRFLGVSVGALITAIIQSSSATTVMVVGFVNSGLMMLENAVWVIMGANIGTTITGLLIAIDITALAPLFAFVGVGMIVFTKNKKLDAIGIILAGLGILFMGMDTMSKAMVPLRTMDEFVSLITKFQNPIIGILVGALFTAVIQSSSASVGVLQALARSGVITLPSAIYVLFGQNIGTCITSVISSIGTNKNAKRTTILHLSFNIIGTIIFVIISMLLPFTSWVEMITASIPGQIAAVHIIFNTVTTLLLLPFGEKLVKLSYIILPQKEEKEEKEGLKFLDFNVFLNDYKIGISSIANTQLFNEIQNMLSVTIKNVEYSFEIINNYQESIHQNLLKNKDYIHYLNNEIVRFTTNAISSEFPIEESESIGLFLKISNDLDKINDHALSIANQSKEMNDKKQQYSKYAMDEVIIMKTMIFKMLNELKIMNYNELYDIAQKIDIIENNISATFDEFSANQLVRLSNKQCSPEKSILFSKTLSDIERIGEYGLSIAKSFGEVKENLIVMKMAENIE